MNLFNSYPKKIDPKKYGFDYGMGEQIIFNTNLFQRCPSCKGKGKVEIRSKEEIKIEKCFVCNGTGAVSKNEG